jgi:replicative DNA helicase
MSEQRILRNTSLKERIDRAEYHVDVDKVAEAILDRAAVRRLIVPSEALSAQADAAAEVGLDRRPSQDVLEAA